MFAERLVVLIILRRRRLQQQRRERHVPVTIHREFQPRRRREVESAIRLRLRRRHGEHSLSANHRDGAGDHGLGGGSGGRNGGDGGGGDGAGAGGGDDGGLGVAEEPLDRLAVGAVAELARELENARGAERWHADAAAAAVYLGVAVLGGGSLDDGE